MEQQAVPSAEGNPVSPANPAETYESYFVPAIFGPWAEELLGRVVPRAGERVLDVACGTGAVARRVAPLVGTSGSVTGIDASPGMLAVARAAAAAGAVIDWYEGGADVLPFPDAGFDLVVCQHGLQFFPDRTAALREMGRVLAPGGRVGITVWRGIEHQSLWAAMEEVEVRHLGSAGGNAPFSLGDEEELRSLIEGAGFSAVTVERVTRVVRFPSPEQFVRLSVLGAAAVIPAFQEMDKAARDGLVDAVTRDVAGPLERYRDRDTVAFPLQAHIATARM